MSPPEVWGPPVWSLFHTLAERMNDNMYHMIAPQLFQQIVEICKYLPCPACAKDATHFLGKVKFKDIKNKTEFKNLIYLFHNYVNAKKHKPLFNHANINMYKHFKLGATINKFIIAYSTKGNMNLIGESFRRDMVLKNFKQWLHHHIRAFITIRHKEDNKDNK